MHATTRTAAADRIVTQGYGDALTAEANHLAN